MQSQNSIDVLTTVTLDIRQEPDVILLVSHVRQQTLAAGMNALMQTKLITAASELARNMLNYAGGGQVRIEAVQQSQHTGLRLVFSDAGPGIADIDKAMQDGFSTGTGMGLGLPGARRLVSEFELVSVVGKGTTITLVMWMHG
jgi:serine/threonine-protein kinase RsbT